MSAGIAKSLADVLRNDLITVQASTYVTNYPSIFNAASAVPTFLYTCLKDIWTVGTVDQGISNSAWASRIQDSYGFGLGGNRVINITPIRILDQVDGPQDGNRSNVPGSEFAEVYVYLKIGGQLASADVDRITQAELRIRRLLDYNYATNIANKPEIPVTDLTINPTADIKAYWQGVVAPPITDKDVAILYYCYYTRLLLK